MFAWLKDKYPSSSYKSLYDLYCVISGLKINSLDASQEKQLKVAYNSMLPCYAPLSDSTIQTYLDLAHGQAEIAYCVAEIPIGAVIVKDKQVIASAHNLGVTSNSALAHAEIQVLASAAKYLGTPYLLECDLYVTVEPCLMCSGAIINSRVKRVIFGCGAAKTGAVLNQYQVFNNKAVNHHTQVYGPIDNAKYSKLVQQFLLAKRRSPA